MNHTTMPDALVSWSGGKDSCRAMWRARQSGMTIRRLEKWSCRAEAPLTPATYFFPEAGRRVSMPPRPPTRSIDC